MTTRIISKPSWGLSGILVVNVDSKCEVQSLPFILKAAAEKTISPQAPTSSCSGAFWWYHMMTFISRRSLPKGLNPLWTRRGFKVHSVGAGLLRAEQRSGDTSRFKKSWVQKFFDTDHVMEPNGPGGHQLLFSRSKMNLKPQVNCRHVKQITNKTNSKAYCIFQGTDTCMCVSETHHSLFHSLHSTGIFLSC